MESPQQQRSPSEPTAIAEIEIIKVIALPLIFACLADVVMVITAKVVVGKLGAAQSMGRRSRVPLDPTPALPKRGREKRCEI